MTTEELNEETIDLESVTSVVVIQAPQAPKNAAPSRARWFVNSSARRASSSPEVM